MIAPGATVAEGQAIMELETDKAVVEVPSSLSGTVKDVLVKQGEKVKVGQVIFTIDNGAGGSAVRPASTPKAQTVEATPETKSSESKSSQPKSDARQDAPKPA